MTQTSFDELFTAAGNGDAAARQQIFALLYDELRRLAQRELRKRGGALTLSPTTLLHEAYLDFHARTGVAFPDRARFMAYACCAMRGLIIDHARQRMAQKRGGGVEIVPFATEMPAAMADSDELVRIGEALEELAVDHAELAQVVDLKYFCGFTLEEIAVMRGVSERTVRRDWEKARLLLYRSLRAQAE